MNDFIPDNTNASVVNANKVSVGFKTDIAFKYKLCADANALGLTTSSYCDLLLKKFTGLVNSNSNVETVSDTKLHEENLVLKRKVDYYENSRIKKFLSDLRGEEFNYYDENGNHISGTVDALEDVYNLMVHSFKYEK